jgi:hypothetical protein
VRTRRTLKSSMPMKTTPMRIAIRTPAGKLLVFLSRRARNFHTNAANTNCAIRKITPTSMSVQWSCASKVGACFAAADGIQCRDRNSATEESPIAASTVEKNLPMEKRTHKPRASDTYAQLL